MKIKLISFGFIALLALMACTAPQPKVVGANRTGAALVATPSTFGATTFTVGKQIACTEPRPNASIDTSLFAQANLNAEQIKAIVDASGGAGTKIGESEEFERVEFLSHGLFGICQLAASGAIEEGQVSELVKQLITSSAAVSGSS